jgi:hypothetical protein
VTRCPWRCWICGAPYATCKPEAHAPTGNLLPYNTATLEEGTTAGWQVSGGGVASAAMQGDAAEGGWFLRATYTAPGDEYAILSPLGVVPFGPGEATVFVSLRGAPTLDVYVQWDAGYRSIFHGSPGPEWIEVTEVLTLPEGTTVMALSVQAYPLADGDVIDLDRAGLFAAAVTEWTAPPTVEPLAGAGRRR